jgi:hypothetical protein
VKLGQPLALVFLLSQFTACAWKITPPDNVREPTAVYLSEYGRHTRLALPDGPEQFLEYGFGDWEYYGQENHSLLSGLAAILGLRDAAFSRRVLLAQPDGSLSPHISGSQRYLRLIVEKEKAASLRQKLESRWEANPERIVRQFDGVPVSRDTASYHLGRNSNHATAAWLRELDVDVQGQPILSNFRAAPEKN